MSESGQSEARQDRAVVTMAIGAEAQGWLAHSGTRFAAYAAKYGFDYVILNEREIKCRIQWRKTKGNVQLEKYQIGTLLDRYERIVFFDADILLSPTCPDFCKMVPPENLGIVADPSGNEAWKRDEEMAAMEKLFGAIGASSGAYFNSGVMVISRAHRELFRFDAKRIVAGRWPEQTALNYHSARLGIKRIYMDSRANFLPGHDGWNDTAKRQTAWAVHYAGPDAKREFFEDATKQS